MAMEVKVLVGAPCGKNPVYDRFYDSFAMLRIPPGSGKIRAVEGSVPHNLNKLVEEAEGGGFSHLFIVEDDSHFAPDTLTRLLAHDKPVVTGLCRSRQAPFRPYIYAGLDGDKGIKWRDLTKDDSGLIKVAATGMGGILINMDVFKVLKRPYFQSYFVGNVEWGQDIVFAKALIEAGIDVYCDTDVIIHHATISTIGSIKIDGEWRTTITVNKADFDF